MPSESELNPSRGRASSIIQRKELNDRGTSRADRPRGSRIGIEQVDRDRVEEGAVRWIEADRMAVMAA